MINYDKERLHPPTEVFAIDVYLKFSRKFGSEQITDNEIINSCGSVNKQKISALLNQKKKILFKINKRLNNK